MFIGEMVIVSVQTYIHIHSNFVALPTSFFKNVLHSLEADLLEVVNASLHFGSFPNSCSC